MTDSIDLTALFGERGNGVHWTLEGPSELNTNLVRLDSGQQMADHVNSAVDVLVVTINGSGEAVIDGETIALTPNRLVHIPRGTNRRIEAGPNGLWYLTVHQRRPGLSIGLGSQVSTS